jgi:hypothetical protein
MPLFSCFSSIVGWIQGFAFNIWQKYSYYFQDYVTKSLALILFTLMEVNLNIVSCPKYKPTRQDHRRFPGNHE